MRFFLTLTLAFAFTSCTTREQKLLRELEPFGAFIGKMEKLDSIPDTMASKMALFASEFPANTQSADYLFTAAALFEKQGQTYRAAQVFEQFSVNYPDHPLTERALIGGGHNYEQVGNYAKSKALYETFLAKFPNSPMAGSVRDNLPLIGLSPEQQLEAIMKKADSTQRNP
jgi:tetratricopeptide (TPR) repeat protein